MSKPIISVIIPVYNAGHFLPACLEPLVSSRYRAHEIIVVDDCSTDESSKIGRMMGAAVLTMPRQSGPAAARNFGAQQARGEILFFVDADVVVKPRMLELIAADFTDNTDVAAVFGSYDDEPAEPNFISQYKNLFHRFVHQQGLIDAGTFWAGCGAIRRDVFFELGGFDAERYTKPTIEDIELGYRMQASGHRILLDKRLQGKHLKRWTMRSMVHTDIFCRAIPWSTLIFERKGIPNDLNLQTSDRISAGVLGLALLILPFAFFKPELLLLMPAALATVIILNNKLYRFFYRQRGLSFAVRAFPLHLLYYLYSAMTFVLCWFTHLFRRQLSEKL